MTELVKIDNLESLSKRLFEVLDVQESTQKEYQYCLTKFIYFLRKNGFNTNTIENEKCIPKI